MFSGVSIVGVTVQVYVRRSEDTEVEAWSGGRGCEGRDANLETVQRPDVG